MIVQFYKNWMLFAIVISLAGCATTKTNIPSADNESLKMNAAENALSEQSASSEQNVIDATEESSMDIENETSNFCAYTADAETLARDKDIKQPILSLKEPWKLSEFEKATQIHELSLNETDKQGMGKSYFLSTDHDPEEGWGYDSHTSYFIGLRNIDDNGQKIVTFFRAGYYEYSSGTSASGSENEHFDVEILNSDGETPVYKVTSQYSSENKVWCGLDEMYEYDPETDSYVFNPYKEECKVHTTSSEVVYPGYILSYNQLKPLVIFNDADYDCTFTAQGHNWTLDCNPRQTEVSPI